jgi:Domain of unknown function (DUF4331)
VKQLALRADTRQAVFVAIACAIAAAVVLGVFGYSRSADASSHREAPFIGGDPQADATDVYAFRSPDNPDTVTLIANYIPLEVAPAGPNFYFFSNDVLYELNVDNDGDAKDDLSFQFRFRGKTTSTDRVINNGDTFLYNTGPITSLDDPDLNQEQFYSVSMLGEGASQDPSREGKLIARNLQVAPANVGPKSYPEGYSKVANQAIYSIGDGIKVFAGPRDDPFFADLGRIFDLLNLGQGTAEDYLADLNVHTIAIQVPIETLKGSEDSIIGVRTTSYRRTTSVLRPVGNPDSRLSDPLSTKGPWVQLSRLDNPLVNELVIPLKDKNRFNGSKPRFDSQFLKYVLDPEPARLIEAIFGVEVPEPPREDLVSIFLTGIEGLNKPEEVKPSSQLRLNMAIEPSNNPNRLGVLGGDNAGFPNGRRLADDVVDIELRALAGATPLTPEFNKAPNNQLGDGVDANDLPFLDTFPYVAEPQDYTDVN